MSDLVFNKPKQDRSVIALSSGTPMIIFNQETTPSGWRSVHGRGDCRRTGHHDVGRPGQARGHAHPVYATFLQRAYDELSHDVALDDRRPSWCTWPAPTG
ncbi:hypothetical protein ACW189_05845 [Limosilactobacillus fermentum]